MNTGTLISWALFAVVLAIGFIGYYLGKSVGKTEGYDWGYVVGHREGQKRWIEAMEERRTGTEGHDALLGVSYPSRKPAQLIDPLLKPLRYPRHSPNPYSWG